MAVECMQEDQAAFEEEASFAPSLKQNLKMKASAASKQRLSFEAP